MGQGLFVYNPQKDVLTQNSLQTSFVWDVCENNSGHIYASSLQEGLLCFDENGKFLQSYPLLSAGTLVQTVQQVAPRTEPDITPDIEQTVDTIIIGMEVWLPEK